MRYAAFLCTFAAFSADFVTILSGEQTVKDPATGFTVRVTTGSFQMGTAEITQREYSALMGTNPSRYRGESRPVENVSWFDAISYANRRSVAEKLAPCYDLATGRRREGCKGYRLPTSAEWAKAFGSPAEGVFRGGDYQNTAALVEAEKAGTKEVMAGSAGANGLYGMAGNVWEWCEDWYSPDPPLDAIRDPQGPPTGVAKVIRGGSFLTGGTQWNKTLRNSLAPRTRSGFTGFRLARTVEPAPLPPPPDSAWLAQFQHPESGVQPALSGPLETLRERWLAVLGIPKLPAGRPAATPVRTFDDPTWRGELIDLAVEPGFPTRIFVAAPVRKPTGRLPVVIVPYYDVDTPVGVDLGGRRLTLGGTRAFARLAAQRGMLAVAVRWYGEGDAEGYDEAVYQLAKRHPGVTPMGKWVWDVQRVIDYLQSRPDVDGGRIGIIGHSLGGKMALYAGAFDPRIKATVSSEPGISLGFSNYGDFWYFGRAIERLHAGADQHELVGLMNPRPFLLIAGESADGAKSWPLLRAAQQMYREKERVGMINHGTGHSPTEDSVKLAMEWLERFLR